MDQCLNNLLVAAEENSLLKQAYYIKYTNAPIGSPQLCIYSLNVILRITKFSHMIRILNSLHACYNSILSMQNEL